MGPRLGFLRVGGGVEPGCWEGRAVVSGTGALASTGENSLYSAAIVSHLFIRVSAALGLGLGLVVAPLPVVAAPAAAASEPDEQAANLKRAEELYRNGERLYTEGSYEAAILAFQESYELSREPQLLYNIGNAYERLGDFANSRRYLDQYRAFAPEKERDVLARRIQALDQRQLEKERREREAAAAATKPEEPAKPAAPVGQPVEPKPIEPTPPPAKPDRVFGPGAIALTAVTAVGLGVGIGFGVKALSTKRAALDSCMMAGDRLLCSDTSSALIDSRRTQALVADIGFAVAGAAAIGLITVIAIKATRKQKSSKQRARLDSQRVPQLAPHVAPHVGPRGGGVQLGWQF